MRIGWSVLCACVFGVGCYTLAAGVVTGRLTLVLAGWAFGSVASLALALSGPRP